MSVADTPTMIRLDPIAALRARGAETEAELDAFLSGLKGDSPPRLDEAVRYSLFAGGKRLRPALALEWFDALGGRASASALSAAGAIELIHTFSLVHDDLPAMDDDDLRRGRPTNHVVYGEAIAVLAGDAMTTLAFELIATRAEPRHVGRLVAELAHASGPAGMVGGQVIDIENEHVRLELPALQRLHAMKTGALLTCACRLGAIAADATPAQLNAATVYGAHLGLAFQIMDDVLDETATPEQMGKATGKDTHAGKNTYPRLIGLAASRERAAEALATADAALADVAAPDRLRTLARFIVERQS